MKFIRWKGFIPFVLIAILVYVFSVYFLDHWLRSSIIKQGTKINEALVDVDSLRLSFLSSRLEIRGFRATDPGNLMSNRLDIGKMIVDLQFWPMLKKKFVVDRIEVSQIQWATPRKKPGKIPSSWAREWAQEEKDQTPSLFVKAYEELKAKYSAQLPDLDLEKLGKNFHPKEWVQLDQLKTYQEAKALPSRVKTFANEWEQKGKNFYSENKASLSKAQKELASLDPKKIQDPIGIVHAIQTAKSLVDQTQKQIKSVQDFQTEAKNSLQKEVLTIAGLRQSLAEDVEDLKKKISFGNVDFSKLSESIFGLRALEEYRKYLIYYEQAKTYLAKYQSAGGKPPKEKRWEGRVVSFPITDHTPSFLLSKAFFSSDTTTNSTISQSFRGKFSAQAQDLSSEPTWIRKPMTASLQADMVESSFQKAFASFAYQVEKTPLTTFAAGVTGLKLKEITLGPKSIFPLAIKTGVSSWKSKVDLSKDFVSAIFDGGFFNLQYDFPSGQKKHPFLQIAQDILREISRFDVKISIRGNLYQPQFGISSSFDEALRSGIERTLMSKIREAQAKLEAFVRKEVGQYIDQGQKLFEEKKGDLEKKISEVSKEAQALRTQAEKRLRDFEAKQKSKAQQKTQKVESNVKKKLGF